MVHWDRLHACELWAVRWVCGLQSDAKVMEEVNSRFPSYLFSLLLLVVLWTVFFSTIQRPSPISLLCRRTFVLRSKLRMG